MTLRKRLPIKGPVRDLYTSVLMKIYILTNEQNEILKVSKDKTIIKESLNTALQKANEKIDEYNKCIENHRPLCEDLLELLDFADEYIQSKQISELQEVEKQTETV